MFVILSEKYRNKYRKYNNTFKFETRFVKEGGMCVSDDWFQA